jgi:hypothetical protein
MKNKICITFLSLFTSVVALSQPYQKGNMLMSAGYQFAALSNDNSSFNNLYLKPLSATYEYFFLAKDKLSLSVGITAEVFMHSVEDRIFMVGKFGLPLQLHFSPVTKLDTYLGYRPYWNQDQHNPRDMSNSYTGLNSEMFLGARYFLTKKLGIYAQVATNMIPVEAGVTFKIK